MNGGNKTFSLQEFLLQTSYLKALQYILTLSTDISLTDTTSTYVLRFINLQIFTVVKSVNLRRNLQIQSHNFPHLRRKISKWVKSEEKRKNR